MAQNLENRQRVIFVSNAKEGWSDDPNNLKALSAEFPNVVFFTDDYDNEHIWSDGHRVNIWKAGQKFIKVHGLAANRSITVNGAIITLTLSDNGLIGLSIGSSINNVVVLGAVPYNYTYTEDKAGSFSEAITRYPVKINGGNGYSKSSDKAYRLSSNANKIALYLAVQPNETGEVIANLSFVNRSIASDKSDYNSAQEASIGEQIEPITLTTLWDLQNDLGLTSNEDCENLLNYSNADIRRMFDNNKSGETPFNAVTTHCPNYVVCRYDIDINKLIVNQPFKVFPQSLSVEDVTYEVRDTAASEWKTVYRKDSEITNINFEPFFNTINIADISGNAGESGGSEIKAKLKIQPCISNKNLGTIYRIDGNNSVYDQLFADYLNKGNIKLTPKIFANNPNTSTADVEIDINELNKHYTELYKSTVDANVTGELKCLEFGAINSPTSSAPYYSVAVTIKRLCAESIQRYLTSKYPETYKADYKAVSIYVTVEADSEEPNLPVYVGFNRNEYLSPKYIYSNKLSLNITTSKFKVGVYVANTEQDNGSTIESSFKTSISSSFANKDKHIIEVGTFNDLTSDGAGISGNGREIILSDYSVSGNANGWVYIVLPKIFNNMAEDQLFSNLLISNSIKYGITDNGINKYAYFSVVPDIFESDNLSFEGYDYVVLKVKTPITGKILLLNNNDSQIYSNVKKWQ